MQSVPGAAQAPSSFLLDRCRIDRGSGVGGALTAFRPRNAARRAVTQSPPIRSPSVEFAHAARVPAQQCGGEAAAWARRLTISATDWSERRCSVRVSSLNTAPHPPEHRAAVDLGGVQPTGARGLRISLARTAPPPNDPGVDSRSDLSTTEAIGPGECCPFSFAVGCRAACVGTMGNLSGIGGPASGAPTLGIWKPRR